jgi:23S rRNA (adenine2030-N6)-methyltransferase
MYGSGLIIYNPPWTLRGALEESLPVLSSLLSEGDGNWKLEWEEPACKSGSHGGS